MRIAFVLPVLVLIASCASQNETVESVGVKNKTSEKNVAAPFAKKIPYSMEHHGNTRIDNYYWMRDDSRTNKEILSHLEAENAYTQNKMAHTEAFQDVLFEEITNRIKKDDASVPFKYKQYFYYRRFEGEKEYPIYARKLGSLEAEEEVILDGNAMAEGHDYFRIGDWSISENENLLAYSTDTLSRRVYTIEFKNLRTGEIYADKLEQTTGQVVWANDNTTLFYIKKDLQTLLGYQVYRHELGSPQSEDVLVYEEKDKSFYTWMEKTKDDSTIMIVHGATITAGASIIDADNPQEPAKKFAPLEDDHEYYLAKLGEWFYILTNWEAKNFRIMKVKAKDSSNKNKWQEVVAHNENVLIQNFDVFKKRLVLSEKKKGQKRLRVLNLKDKRSHVIAFDDPVYVASLDLNVNTDTDIVRVSYSSMTTPLTIYDYDMASRQLTKLKQEEVIGEFDPAKYASERIFVEARDGKQVPVSIVYRKDKFKKDGTNPVYQYGYGSYGSNIEPYFRGSHLSILDRGFVYAIAHIRGSQTLGRDWYEDGKMFNKINTFTDFIDVTKALVEQKYAAPDKVFAVGGSAGGLLMGAIVNMEPELYRGIASHVPFVDVVTTMLDESIPLTTNEYDEWGNPNNKDSYEYMLSYSPYDNIQQQDYPNILVTTGLHDSQVQYFEPAKWVAKLREMKTDDNLLLFKVNMEAGHGGASGRFRRNRNRALEYAFFMDLIDIKQ